MGTNLFLDKWATTTGRLSLINEFSIFNGAGRGAKGKGQGKRIKVQGKNKEEMINIKKLKLTDIL